MQLRTKLTQTLASISNQKEKGWQGIVVANEGADLPPLPLGFSAVRVDFPADKGRRVLKSMLAARDSKCFMIVDDDDFVSARITGLVCEEDGANGWFINRGYVWSDGGSLLLGHNEFNKFCGTSLIVRSDLYELPNSLEEASLEWIKKFLGSHIFIRDHLHKTGTPLAELPFRGAIYRVGHAGSHSQAGGILSSYFLNASAMRRPRNFVRNALRLRILTRALRNEFFGK